MDSLRKDSETENQEERVEEEEELGDVEVDEYDTSIAMKAATMKSKKRSKRSVRIVFCMELWSYRPIFSSELSFDLEGLSDLIIDLCFKMHPCMHIQSIFLVCFPVQRHEFSR